MSPADFDLRDGSAIQSDLARQFLLAKAAGPSAGRDTASDLDPCSLIRHSAVIALSLACGYQALVVDQVQMVRGVRIMRC